jgi:aryl-alcohol dehydrogenase-like predicted oxidoreductase
MISSDAERSTTLLSLMLLVDFFKTYFVAWQVSRGNMLADLRGWSPFVAYQGKYHIGERDMEREFFPMAEELGLGVVPWGVVGQGIDMELGFMIQENSLESTRKEKPLSMLNEKELS